MASPPTKVRVACCCCSSTAVLVDGGGAKSSAAAGATPEVRASRAARPPKASPRPLRCCWACGERVELAWSSLCGGALDQRRAGPRAPARLSTGLSYCRHKQCARLQALRLAAMARRKAAPTHLRPHDHPSGPLAAQGLEGPLGRQPQGLGGRQGARHVGGSGPVAVS